LKARLIRIGNSRGLRLPKPLISEAGLEEEGEVHVRDGALIITSAARPRTGWAEAAKRIHERHEDTLADRPADTEFDKKQWQWQSEPGSELD